MRWSRFRDAAPAAMFEVISERAFPFLRTLGGDRSTYSQHMKDARFTIPMPALLAKVVDMLGDISMDGRDTKGDPYEYMLAKIATAGLLVEAGEYLRRTHTGSLDDAAQRKHFHRNMFHGYDSDNTMLRIGSMNHAAARRRSPDIVHRDSLALFDSSFTDVA